MAPSTICTGTDFSVSVSGGPSRMDCPSEWQVFNDLLLLTWCKIYCTLPHHVSSAAGRQVCLVSSLDATPYEAAKKQQLRFAIDEWNLIDRSKRLTDVVSLFGLLMKNGGITDVVLSTTLCNFAGRWSSKPLRKTVMSHPSCNMSHLSCSMSSLDHL